MRPKDAGGNANNKNRNDENAKSIIDRFKEYVEIFNFVTPGIIVILTFIMKIIFMTEYQKFYEIPIKYFAEIDLREFFVFLIIFVGTVFLFIRNPSWKFLSDSDSNSKFTSTFLTIGYIVLLLLIFFGYNYLIRIYLIKNIITPILIIIIILLLFFRLGLKYKLPLILYLILFIIYLIVKNRVFVVSIPVVIFVLSIIISLSIVKNYYDLKKYEYNSKLYNFYDRISTIIILLFTFLLIINMDIFPQFRKEYEIIPKEGHECDVIVGYYDGKGIILDGDLKDDVLIFYTNSFKLSDISEKEIKVVNLRNPPTKFNYRGEDIDIIVRSLKKIDKTND